VGVSPIGVSREGILGADRYPATEETTMYPVIRYRLAHTMITLRDWSPLLIRQIRAADTPLVDDIFDRLSEASRWLQFLGAKKELSPAELRYLTEVDHHDHEALAAWTRPAGAARASPATSG
jgi:hypothetical protein